MMFVVCGSIRSCDGSKSSLSRRVFGRIDFECREYALLHHVANVKPSVKFFSLKEGGTSEAFFT